MHVVPGFSAKLLLKCIAEMRSCSFLKITYKTFWKSCHFLSQYWRLNTLFPLHFCFLQNLTKEQADYCISHMKPYLDSKGRELPSAFDFVEFTRSLFVNWNPASPCLPVTNRDVFIALPPPRPRSPTNLPNKTHHTAELHDSNTRVLYSTQYLYLKLISLCIIYLSLYHTQTLCFTDNNSVVDLVCIFPCGCF